MIFKIYEPLDTKKGIEFTKRLVPHIALAIRLGMEQSGKELRAYTREQMLRGAKTGRVYKVYTGLNGRKLTKPKFHRASAGGEFPARRSGNLLRSIDFTVFGSKRLEFGARARYAKYLELGTSKIAPRQFLKQTVKKLDKQTQINIVKRINQAIKAKSK